MTLTLLDYVALLNVAAGRFTQLSRIGITYRERLVAMTRTNPVLVLISGDYVALTAAGQKVLKEGRNVR